MIDGNEFYKYASPCIEKGIKIYVVPTARKDIYKIEIDNNGKITTGKIDFPN